jgi:hypothetical protein
MQINLHDGAAGASNSASGLRHVDWLVGKFVKPEFVCQFDVRLSVCVCGLDLVL